MTLAGAPAIADVLAAARRLEGVARRTPLERSDALSGDAEVFLKLEGLQRTGSFKLRGAFNRVATLAPEVRARGLVTASAGNHGQGVALAARLLGARARARVFVPAGAPETKRRRIARFGAELVLVEGGYDDAHAAAGEFARESGCAFVHAYSDPQTVAGQGTVALEIFQELPAVRTLVVPVGGGGLVNGTGVVARALGPGVRVVGVQTDTTGAMHASLAAGALCCPPQGETLCEGLSGETDARSLALARRVVDEVVLVSEDAVRRAMRWLFVEEGVVAEGSAAVAAAALLEGALRPEGPVAVILSGSNVDAGRLAGVLGSE